VGPIWKDLKRKTHDLFLGIIPEFARNDWDNQETSQSWQPLIIFLIGIVGGRVQLGPLGTATTNWPIVPAPGDYDDGEIGGMMIGRGNRSTGRKPAPVPLCPPQIPHAYPDANPDRRGGKPATNRLSYGTAMATVIYNENRNGHSHKQVRFVTALPTCWNCLPKIGILRFRGTTLQSFPCLSLNCSYLRYCRYTSTPTSTPYEYHVLKPLWWQIYEEVWNWYKGVFCRKMKNNKMTWEKGNILLASMPRDKGKPDRRVWRLVGQHSESNVSWGTFLERSTDFT
jgi:hypothetical protein